MLWRLEGRPDGKPSLFEDVPAVSWYEKAVNWAAEAGVVKGITDMSFAPDMNVTREQLVTILYRYAQAKSMDVSVGEDTNILSWNDAFDVSEWAMPAMQWACGASVIEGRDDGTLAPQDNAARAEIAAIFMRLFKEDIP